jgi:hypothetical protein
VSTHDAKPPPGQPLSEIAEAMVENLREVARDPEAALAHERERDRRQREIAIEVLRERGLLVEASAPAATDDVGGVDVLLHSHDLASEIAEYEQAALEQLARRPVPRTDGEIRVIQPRLHAEHEPDFVKCREEMRRVRLQSPHKEPFSPEGLERELVLLGETTTKWSQRQMDEVENGYYLLHDKVTTLAELARIVACA